MNTKFSEYTHLDLSAINKDILAYWDKHDIFKKSIDTRTGNPTFVFYEGPPSANGMPGIHHVMARTIKDLFLRYKTMKGYQVQRKAGWDTHGLPVELGVEKSLGITKEDIGKSISVEEYNAACRKDVMKYTKEWESLTHKMGYWVDMNHPYITYDNKFIESIWWLLKELYNKNLLYKGYTIQPYSPAAGSGLSSHELNQPGCYKDVKDTTVVAQFEIDNPIAELTQFGKAYFLAWTTTPWTLPSNTALCVGATITYVAVQTYNPYTFEPQTVILAKDLVSAHFNGKASSLSLSEYTAGDKLIPYSIIAEYKGSELVGMTYKQLIPFFKPDEGAFSVISGDFVTTEDGTGIVHIAPTFGADDARVAKMNNIPAMLLIDKNGNERPLVDLQGKFYTINDIDNDFVAQRTNIALYSPFAGRYVKNAYDTSLNENDATLDIDLCVMLKQQGLAFKIEKHIHNYPHCWRTDKPVLYYPLDSWFIRSTACRETMVELNNTINWKPQATGTGRFGKWLENLQDWNLSRSRYWGTPLPIWRTEDKQEEICIGSIAELMAEIEKAIQAGMMNKNPFKDFVVNDFSEDNYGISRIDLHRPYVDNIILVSPSGKPMKRETDLIDVWFDSGAMPYAQLHYPFENKALIDGKTNFPADFISEGVDQTRGWFFTLHAISTMIKGSVAFKNVVSNGLVLDKNGNKMSKRLGNAVDPFSTIETYGSDALRWYMMTNASPWDNLKFDTEGIEEVKRKLFGTLYNTYSFFVLYANVDGFAYKEPEVPMEQRQEIDRWIISLLHSLVKEVDENYADYEPTRAGRAITTFVTDNLSNWYVRLNRRRYWAGEMTLDKLAAYQTLYTCLETVAKLMAPIAPFFAERLFLDLNSVTQKDISESIHLAQFPTFSESLINKQLEERMFIAQTITSLVLALRKKVNLKVRQPLSSIMIPVLDNNMKEDIEAVKELILNEVNVKSIQFVDNSAGILVKRIKADFKKLGPKCGKHMKQVSTLLQEMSQPQIAEFEKIGNYTLSVENNVNITISTQDVEIISEDIPGWLVANEGKITIALDITLTDELKEEGIARELVNRIQNIRKANGFDITDRISIVIEKNPLFNQAIENYKQYIASQTLAKSIEISDKINNGIELEFENDKLYLLIQKIA
ncbi:MAG: isoleucine--tRNA ligase [Paludibacteraceae bacterium]|jgi:isoleucyl-tRNA synthetase|nr:isoleucine--tRNA ligase [Paludibacteraceae bacterium]MBP8626976.1 isoleucine--tRNA ligase [Paludibacteraceae bacterium]MBP9648665.1 isoleucine--tRNA ligase [Paludibacteraceae bacterium]MBP9969940.1 isoleucine--tRNA ligase [Paludibacteraceae bacterium]